jgi:exonuclease SbcD
MKILHTSDWHLGKKLDGFDRTAEIKEVFDEIYSIVDSEKIDIVLIAGDLFDNFNPSNESMEMLYGFCMRLTHNAQRLVIAIAGNHDSPERVELPDIFSRSRGIIFYGSPNTTIPNFTTESGFEIKNSEPLFIEINAPYFEKPLQLFLLPYLNEQRLLTFLGENETEKNIRSLLTERLTEISVRNQKDAYTIGVAHLLVKSKEGEIPIESDDEKPIRIGGADAFIASDFPENWDYLALGHIHKRMTIQKKPYPIIYCGSPIALSFSETNQEKYVEVIEFKNGKVKTEHRVLQSAKKITKLTFDTLEAIEQWCRDNSDTLVQISLITRKSLTPSDTKHLFEKFPNIVPPIVPIMINSDDTEIKMDAQTLMNSNIRDLFKKYYAEKNNGVAPNQDILNLFEEVLATE